MCKPIMQHVNFDSNSKHLH
uniref:Uncharacterized protein n=1 Tax=Arundo donax TaxID=35708 RepID=A0A0A9A103_ARUDO